MTSQHEEADIIVLKCFLCNVELCAGDLAFSLFGERFQANGEPDFTLSEVLTGILSYELVEESIFSKVICEGCNARIHRYEEMEQQLLEVKYKIIHDFNITSKANGGDIIQFEIEEIEELNVGLEEPSLVDETTTDIIDDIPKEVGSNDDTVDVELMSVLVEESEKDDQKIEDNQKENIKLEFDTEIDGTEYYDQNTGNMVEITAENDEFEQLIDQQHQSSSDVAAVESIEDQIQSDLDTTGLLIKLENRSNSETENANTTLRETKRKRMKAEPPEPTKPSFTFDGEKFKCILCSPTLEASNVEYDVRTMSAHLRTVHNLRLYICDICGADFRKRNELTEHMDEDHGGTEDGVFLCEICNRVFTNLRLFRIHKRLHYSSAKTFHCNQCNKKYSSKNLLDEHMNMHTGVRPYKCNHCPKDFASKYTLTAHLKIHSDRPRPFTCKSCNKSFFSIQNLQQHEKIHSGVKEYICEVCNKAFGTQHNLEVHKVVHTGYKPFICRTCGKAFARRAEIKDHERTHTGEKPFKCDICQMSFAQRSNLTTHKRATHFNDKRYKCEECDRSFKRRRLLDYHIRASHTGERPYVCNMCSATFVYPEHFKKHLRIHTGVKPYACEVCGKTFNSRDNRNAHRFIHSDKKPYECLVCGQGFMRKPLLYAHMQQSGHVNDTIIINQPRIATENDDKTEEEEDNFIEEQITEDSEMVEEHLIIDGPVQFGSNTTSQDGIDDSTITNEMLEDNLTEEIHTTYSMIE